ncbi:MAG: phosphonoacetaldehyde hydrolase [Limnohabitans sp.]|nr:MAG: phosphonoacetaldehyde hydrolase [Limnohabitans sp.]
MNIKGVVFDWAGTIVDFGSLAPMGAFVELFARHEVTISIEQARIPMGLPKLEHIRQLGAMPAVAMQWHQRHGRVFADSDAHSLLQEFEPMSAESALARCDFIPGLLETQAWLRKNGIRIATTTGYTRRIMTPIIDQAKLRGFSAERVVCCDDVSHSRPDPMGMELCMQTLDLQGQAERVVKVDDTEPGLAEGRHAGCWTVGVAASGNALGWSMEQWLQASKNEQNEALHHATAVLKRAGADEVIPTVAELPQALLQIDLRMARGERPIRP